MNETYKQFDNPDPERTQGKLQVGKSATQLAIAREYRDVAAKPIHPDDDLETDIRYGGILADATAPPNPQKTKEYWDAEGFTEEYDDRIDRGDRGGNPYAPASPDIAVTQHGDGTYTLNDESGRHNITAAGVPIAPEPPRNPS